jgi:hypothetical protein
MLKNTWFSELSHDIWSKQVDWKKYEKESNHMEGSPKFSFIRTVHDIIFFLKKKKDHYMYSRVTSGYLKKKK